MAEIVREKQEQHGGVLPRIYFRVCSKDEVRFTWKPGNNCQVNYQTTTHPGRLHVAVDDSMVRVYVDQDQYERPTLKGFNVYPKTR